MDRRSLLKCALLAPLSSLFGGVTRDAQPEIGEERSGYLKVDGECPTISEQTTWCTSNTVYAHWFEDGTFRDQHGNVIGQWSWTA